MNNVYMKNVNKLSGYIKILLKSEDRWKNIQTFISDAWFLQKSMTHNWSTLPLYLIQEENLIACNDAIYKFLLTKLYHNSIMTMIFRFNFFGTENIWSHDTMIWSGSQVSTFPGMITDECN